MENLPHAELQAIKLHLLQIYDAIASFKPLTARPPICDSSYDAAAEVNEENQWLHQEIVPGLKKLKECIKLDLAALEKFLDNPQCANLPPLSTNAPYLVAVWNEVLCAPGPVVSIFKTFLFNIPNPSDKSRKRSEQVHPPGAKVDVVADNGRRWIRVNTVKNSRLLSEFREIDSYLTDSEEESDSCWDNVERPSLAQTEFDNSILRMGRSLLRAAQANLIEGTAEVPLVTLRLTRLDPGLANEDGTPPDPRIAKTVECLRDMGVVVELGERTSAELPELLNSSGEEPSTTPTSPFIPTRNINLDLSVLIALISDLTHAPLPHSVEEANKRFVPPPEYREWKQKRLAMTGKHQNSRQKSSTAASAAAKQSNAEFSVMETDINDLPGDLIKHSRALTNQLLQEMGKGLLQELHDRISSAAAPGGGATAVINVSFWTTSEARDRCQRIVSKIGGIHEKRRARALFCLGPTGSEEISLEEAEKLYWQDSRFPVKFIPLLPIKIFTAASPDPITIATEGITLGTKTPFGLSLSRVCSDILAQEIIPHPRTLPEDILHGPASIDSRSEIQRATVTKANPRLTAHTVQSMRWGAELAWTTLTANRTSVKAILRELKTARIAGRLAGAGEDDEEVDHTTNFAAIWIVDPRSLAEGMSSLPSTS